MPFWALGRKWRKRKRFTAARWGPQCLPPAFSGMSGGRAADQPASVRALRTTPASRRAQGILTGALAVSWYLRCVPLAALLSPPGVSVIFGVLFKCFTYSGDNGVTEIRRSVDLIDWSDG